MSGFTEIKVRNVKLVHYSTSSQIKIITTTEEEIEQGKFKLVEE